MNRFMNRLRQGIRLYVGISLLILLFLSSSLVDTTQGQVTPAPITSSGLNTQVSTPIAGSGGTTQFNITGGTRPGSGPNLFHSFGEFGIPTNNIANFLNETSLPTTNILSRVTGGNPSNIFGTIQTTGFGSANLFLMNPAGIVFGPSASLNVGGSASFTTADYLRFADGAQFHAIPGPQDASISSAPVAAFGFLGSNPAAITVQGGQLAVAEGQALSLVGGNITIEGATLAPETVQPAQLFAPGGRINLASVASSGEVLFSSLQSAPNVNGESFTQMGNISLTGGSTVDVSADGAGTVTIRGGQFVIAEGTISADTVNSNGAPTAIDVAVTGNLSLANDLAPAITARTSGEGNAGAITLTSGGMEAITSALEDGVVVALIDSHTSGPGRGGDITIVTGDLHATNQNFFIDSGSAGPGHGGDVTISGKNILIEGSGHRDRRFSIRATVWSGGDRLRRKLEHHGRQPQARPSHTLDRGVSCAGRQSYLEKQRRRSYHRSQLRRRRW